MALNSSNSMNPLTYRLKWTELLSELKVSALLNGELGIPMEVISVHANDSVLQVLELLTKHQISSAPVYDRKLKKYVGLVDMLDLVTYCIIKLHKNQTGDWDRVRQFEEFASTEVRFIIDLSDRDRWHAVDSEVKNNRIRRLVASINFFLSRLPYCLLWNIYLGLILIVL
jgi:hypothetical protein